MNLYLIGYRGSGKSTVAPLVAKRLGRVAVDADDLIEDEAEMSIAEIFTEFGESEFRRRETNTIAALAEQDDFVVSLGGGAPMSESNRELIAGSGKTVWLNGSVELLWHRISGDESTSQRRPDLTDQGGQVEVEQMLAQRCPVYAACADYTIEIESLSPEEIAERIVKWWKADDKKTVESA